MERFFLIHEKETEITIHKAHVSDGKISLDCEPLQSIPKPLSTYAEMIYSAITKGQRPL